MEPAQKIIEICGGYQAVAKMTGRTISRVHRWTYPKDRGGTDGLIPSDAQQILLREAIKRGLPLTPAHFFPEFDGTEVCNIPAASVDNPNQETSHDNS